MLARYSEGRLQFQSRLFTHTDTGAGTDLSLQLPAGAAAVSVSGEDVANWKIVRTDAKPRLLEVHWKTADILDRQVMVAYTMPQSPLATEWQLQALVPPGAPASKHLYAIVPSEGLELAGEGLRNSLAAQQLPEWMRSEIGSTAFSTAEAGPQLTVQTHWLPVVQSAEAVITAATSLLRLVPDGSMQTECTFAIRHQTPMAWKLDLPADVELLSCMLDGKPARPVQRSANLIEFSLPTPAATAKGISTITLMYAAKHAALDPVSGRVALELPSTALFIERLQWAVNFPDLFEVTAIEGNVALGPDTDAKSADSGNLIQLRKDLCRGERPNVELFYQRRAPNQ